MKKTLLFSGLCGLSALLLPARSPGGVEGADVWYKAVPETGDLQGLYRWLDFSGDSVTQYARGRDTVPQTFTQSRKQIRSLNFNPALDFSEGDTPKWSALRHSPLTQGTVIGVFSPRVFETDGVMFGISGGDGGGSLVTGDRIVRPGSMEPLDYGDSTGEDLLHTAKDSVPADILKEHATKVLTYFRAGRPGTSVWGLPGGTLTVGGYSPADGHFGCAFDTSSFDSRGFQGYMPELIVYSRILTPGERRRAESYLAMKYGITLNDSYLDGDGNLVWDRGEAGAHHNRVTAISRNDAGDFNQPMSATSYEEGPNYATLAGNDSYSGSNSYGLPSRTRLLVMGREYGNQVPDKTALLWGDDGGGLETYTSPGDSLWHIMDRTWLVRTNTPTAADSTAKRWTATGMTVTPEGFLDAVRQDEDTPGTAVTPELPDGTGSIGFRCPHSHPAFEVGFARTGDGGAQYGYRIGSDGSVRTVSGGEAGAEVIAADANGRDVSVILSGGEVRLRIDGEGNSGYTVTLPEDAAGAGYRGIISAEASPDPLVLTSVRSNGASETGYLAELAHDLMPGKEFRDHSLSRTVMLVDPTGQGRFDADNTVMVRCSPPDIQRGKTMFHNIPWDADGSGSDMFTFAYFDGIKADVLVEPTTCSGGAPQKDGAIEIGITFGTPAYGYTLAADSVAGMERGDIVASGAFTGASHRIEGLATGRYALTVTQGGGTDIYAWGKTPYAAYSCDGGQRTDGEIAWTVADTASRYRLGADPASPFSPDTAVIWGYDVRGDMAYPIVDGYTGLSQGISIRQGDTLGVSISGTTVRWHHNGAETRRVHLLSSHSWRLCVRYGRGYTRVTGLTIEGGPAPDLESHGDVYAETSGRDTAAYTVHVGNGCDMTVPNGVEPARRAMAFRPGASGRQALETEDSSLTVVAEDGGARIFNAVLDIEWPGAATLMVFDASGRLVSEGEMEGAAIKTRRFTVPTAGVYIVKAITDRGEHTRKIIAR